MEGNVDLLVSLCISPEFDCRAHYDRAVVVCSTGSLTSVPDKLTTIGKYPCSNSRAIVASPSNQHHSHLSDVAINLEVVDGLFRRRHVLTTSSFGDSGSTVYVLALDVVIGVDDIWRIDSEEIFLFKGD